MKAEIKNVKVTLGDREFEFTVEELQALRKAIEDFLPKEKINNTRSNDTILNEEFKKLFEKESERVTPKVPWYPHNPTPPYDPNRIWCSVKQFNSTKPENSTDRYFKNEHIQ